MSMGKDLVLEVELSSMDPVVRVSPTDPKLVAPPFRSWSRRRLGFVIVIVDMTAELVRTTGVQDFRWLFP